MKKMFLYSGVLLSMLSFASCDDSFNDWAELKTHEAATNRAYGLKNRGVCQNSHPLLKYHKARTFTSSGFAIP